MIKLIIFDFDGTLADSKKRLLGIVSRNLKQEGHKINREFEKRFGDKPLKESLKGFGVKSASEIIKKIHEDFVKESGKIRLAKNIESLRKIKTKKIVISNNIKRYIAGVLKKNSRLFDEIHGWPEFNENKIEEIKKILKKKKINPKEAIYAGDRVIDAKVARKVGCISVLVANKISWSPEDELLKAGADYIIPDLKELNKIINKINSN